MKRNLLFLLLTISLCVSTRSQSIEEGKKHLYYQRYASAESVLHHYLQQQPTNDEAWFLLTKSYLLQNKIEKAADSIALAPSILSDEPYLLIAKGGLALHRNETAAARDYFDKAISLTKGKNTQVLEAIADIETLGDYGDLFYALSVLEKVSKKDKNNAGFFSLKGFAYFKMHNGGEAYKSYSHAIDIDKNLAEPYYWLGKIFLSQKNEELYTDFFARAIAADSNYAPAFYELYNYYVYVKPDPAKAMSYFRKYVAKTDKTVQQDYSYTDLLYLTKDYSDAIGSAQKLILRYGNGVKPRIYKLIAYGYAEQGDSLHAISYMRHYFTHENDSNFIAKDFETMAQLYLSLKYDADSAIAYFKKASTFSNDSTMLYSTYKNLAANSASNKDYRSQAKWLAMYHAGNNNTSNVDLFNWGIAAYRSDDYLQADSVFGLYMARYPEQGFGYYWRARTNAVMDTAMTEGLAIPYYEKLLEVVKMDSLSATDKKWVLEAYAYLAAYETNTQKDYEKAIDYFDKILEIDPENAVAKRYIPILETNVKKEKDSNNN